MKKLFIAAILFMLALTVVADNPLYNLLQTQRTNLTTGITMADTPNPADFTELFGPVVQTPIFIQPQHWAVMDSPFAYSWYKHDFTEDPFDGRIEVLVMGEPLPTPIVTLLLMLGIAGMCYIKQRWSVV